ncbi:TonB family protein [Undibacterium griseum]|uniref:TonB family protein n=1 Tax=Undibacterium griseum TaxID=2762295 RepID=A0ABR6YMQ5_9BURK|nr:TonB family protein [Undibacterium griseum]MBC3885177.1 TonB family protein [Undibacterium griseum]
MNLFPVTNASRLPPAIKKRLTAGLLLSLLVHGLILSLQFGLPGLGLPGIEKPWSKRRSTEADQALQITLAPAPAAQPAATSVPTPASMSAPLHESVAAPAQLPPSVRQATTISAPANAIELIAPAARARLAPSAPLPHKKKQAAASIRSKTGSVKPLIHEPRHEATAVPDIIAQDSIFNDSFVVAVPHPDDIKKTTDAALAPRQFADPVSASMAQQTPEPETDTKPVSEPVADAVAIAEPVTRFEPDAAQRQRREAERLVRPEELTPQKAGLSAEAQQTLQAIDDDARRRMADAARAQAMALQLEQDAEQHRLMQEALRANAAALAAAQSANPVRLDDARLQQQLQAESAEREQQRRERVQTLRVNRELAEQREEAAEQQRVAESRRREQEQLQQRAEQAQQQAEAARHRAEQQAMQQREQEAAAALEQRGSSTAQSGQVSQNAPGGVSGTAQQGRAAFVNRDAGTAGSAGSAGAAGQGQEGAGDQKSLALLPRNLYSSDLANRAREQARGLDLLSGTPPLPRNSTEEKPRRHSVFGSSEKDVQLRMYVDSWKQKVERNGNLNYSQTSKDKARGDPLVTVAIRSDGSVEEITIHRSSGRADLDQAVRNIVRINARYAAFPPAIAAQYDVIEIRRIWNFDEGLKILEELR